MFFEFLFKHKFAKSLFGFDPKEVHSFLTVIDRHMKNLLSENKKLREELDNYKNPKISLKAYNSFPKGWDQVNAIRKAYAKEAELKGSDATSDINNLTFQEIERLSSEIEKAKAPINSKPKNKVASQNKRDIEVNVEKSISRRLPL